MYLHLNGKDNKENNDVSMESLALNYESKFAQAIVAVVCRALRISSRDRRIVEALLLEVIEQKVTWRGELLEQYLHTQLDILANTIKDKFNLDDNVKVNYEYITRAKFKDIIKAIKEKYNTH